LGKKMLARIACSSTTSVRLERREHNPRKLHGPPHGVTGLRAVPEATVDDLDAYLMALAGASPASAFIEIRHRVGEQSMVGEFHPAHDRAALTSAICRRARHTDVYVGCAPRTRRSGTKNDIAELWVVWAECDGVEAARAARAYEPAPAIVVASGSGSNVHAYWPLKQPLSPLDAEVVNPRLAYAIAADRVCFDAARILRPPGTWNHKHDPPSPVRALRLERDVAFSVSEVVAHAARAERDVAGDPLLRIPPAVYTSELLGVPARPGRKVHCPFHDDAYASLHVYPTAARGWSCFSCGRGGSIYDLAAGVWRLRPRGREFLELRRLLTERFSRELARPARGIER
jgi:CHC2 zinc finger